MTTAETRALNLEAAPGVISLSEPDGGNREVDALLEHNGAGREPAKPRISAQDAHQTISTDDYTTPSSSELHSW